MSNGESKDKVTTLKTLGLDWDEIIALRELTGFDIGSTKESDEILVKIDHPIKEKHIYFMTRVEDNLIIYRLKHTILTKIRLVNMKHDSKNSEDDKGDPGKQ